MLQSDFFMTLCLVLLCLPAAAQTDPPRPDTAKHAAPPAPKTYFIPGDTLEDEELLRIEKERRKSELDLREKLESLKSLDALKDLDNLEVLDALDALEAVKAPSEESRAALEKARRQLEGLVIATPRVGDIGGEIILPDTVYTTEITIGPTGIEFYDTAGTPVFILGEPKGLGDVYVFSDEGNLISTEDIVQIGTSVTVDKNERVEGNVVVFGGDVHVTGEVKGDAVAIFGDVIVDGYVHGSAVAPLGEVEVTSTGRVRKDVVGGTITLAPGSMVGGKRERTNVRIPVRPQLFQGIYLAIFFIYLGVAVFVIFLTLLAHAFGAKNIKTVGTRVAESGVKSFFVGLVSMLLGVPLAFVLLIITVIGIPVAILVLPLAVFLAKVMGYAAVGLRFGGKLAENTVFKARSQLAQTLLGTAGLLMITMIGCTLIIIPTTPIQVIGWILFGIGIAVSFVATTTGIGAVVLTRFGTRLHKNGTSRPTPSAIPPPPSSIQPGTTTA
jgi:cytoskeletal protein CcmA (bactofilin family)